MCAAVKSCGYDSDKLYRLILFDAFIIDRIRREREAAKGSFTPLRVEIPLPPPEEESLRPQREPHEERGVAEIDFTI